MAKKKKYMLSWPAMRQLTAADPMGLREAAMSRRSQTLKLRTLDADRVAASGRGRF